ncbi:Ig-like domain-containing protein [Wenzhouxiangella sp. XN24]|uniref:Ig-like domain-containing protein n=1 Tax=Wenzhouxiangella sp. XN24 TaxID=2713569 RepID=UPI0013ED72E8|nr:Ig-like domain-containing protein [Wenzhouxiangella sp. XN24]NGX17439.1 hypothetical protein [Wenzhouxiangella sp. XN24]
MSNRFTRRVIGLPAFLAAMFLVGCGSDSTIVQPEPPEGGGGTSPVSSITLVASSNLLPSAGSNPVTLTAFVRDANNNVVEGVPVTFSADSGLLQVIDSLTDATGSASAELGTGGDPTNRPIVVQASTGTLADAVTVTVSGTTLTLEGPDNVILGDVVPFTARLRNSAGAGLGGRSVEISSEAGNVLSATSLVTNTQGDVSFEVTGTEGGDDTIAATALGLTAQAPLSVSAEDSLVFIEPVGGAEIPLGTSQPVTVEWRVGGVAQSGTVNFSTTRGQLSALSAALVDGSATVNISAATAGPATLTARVGSAGPETQRAVEFVATTPATIVVQASRFTVGPGEQSTIVATVRDAAGNPVKNKVVQFQIEDVTGGSLSVGTATTGSAGTAQTIYTGGETISGSGDVIITAIVQEDPTLTETVGLTVARREVDISIGTGNELFEPNSATYEREFIVQVTDSQGVGVPNAQVQLSARSKIYRKGFYVEGDNDQWVVGPNLTCPDEDFNANGQLDANEDFNNSGQLEAGNAVSVSPGEVVTNDSGTALFRIVYAQEFGNWLTVTINARAAVQGTAFEESSDHALEILASDANVNQSPPGGIISRFGGSDLDATPDATDPLLGDPLGGQRLIELGFPGGRPLGCRTLN